MSTFSCMFLMILAAPHQGYPPMPDAVASAVCLHEWMRITTTETTTTTLGKRRRRIGGGGEPRRSGGDNSSNDYTHGCLSRLRVCALSLRPPRSCLCVCVCVLCCTAPRYCFC